MAEHTAIETTLRALEQSKTPAAQLVLMHALSVEDQTIRDLAARAIVRSGNSLAKTEVIRNINRLSAELIEEIGQDEKSISFPLRQCLQHGDVPSSLKALETIEAARFYQEIPFLLKFLGQASGTAADRAEQALLALVDQLYEDRLKLKLSDPSAVNKQCEDLLQVLGVELSRFELLKRPRALVEAVLILSFPEHGVAHQLIRESSAESQAVVWDTLMNSKHPGVMNFLIQSMSQKYIHPRKLEIFSRRRDIEFQYAVVSHVPETFSTNQERNYCQLQSLPWLFPSEELWQRFPPHWHGRVLKLVDAIAYQSYQKAEFYESVLKYGSGVGKAGAARNRHLLKPQFFDQIVLESLESPEEGIEAWAVSELRYTDIPDKYRYLVNRLDSSREQVCLEARKALGRFDVQNAIVYCESARPSLGPRIAELLLKINPNACQELSRELASPVRTRRLRAAKAVAFMNLELQVCDALVEMLYDSDAVVRRSIAEILGNVPVQSVISALTLLLEDSNIRVRETAQESLDRIDALLRADLISAAAPSEQHATQGEPISLADREDG